jgi:hypothetical protein
MLGMSDKPLTAPIEVKSIKESKPTIVEEVQAKTLIGGVSDKGISCVSKASILKNSEEYERSQVNVTLPGQPDLNGL